VREYCLFVCVCGVYTHCFHRRYGEAYVQCFAKLLYVAFFFIPQLLIASWQLPIAFCSTSQWQKHKHTHAFSHLLTHSNFYTLSRNGKWLAQLLHSFVIDNTHTHAYMCVYIFAQIENAFHGRRYSLVL